jgi:hypothetical protein
MFDFIKGDKEDDRKNKKFLRLKKKMEKKKLIGKNKKLGKEAKYEIIYDKKKKEMKKYKIENGKRIKVGEIVPKEEWLVYEPLHSYINNK